MNREEMQHNLSLARRESMSADRRRMSSNDMAADAAAASAAFALSEAEKEVPSDLRLWQEQVHKRRRGSDSGGIKVSLDGGWARRGRRSSGSDSSPAITRSVPLTPRETTVEEKSASDLQQANPQDHQQQEPSASPNEDIVVPVTVRPHAGENEGSAEVYPIGSIPGRARRSSFALINDTLNSAKKGVRSRRNSTTDYINNLVDESKNPILSLGFTRAHSMITLVCQRLRDAKWFQTFIIAVIFLAGGVVGVQTYDVSDPGVLRVINQLDRAILTIFIFESLLKLVAEGKVPINFFKDNWNFFDFWIVVVSLLPFGGGAVTALRLVRLLRVLKLVRALPKLRILVIGLLKSMSSIAYIGLLLMMLFYLYAVLAVSLFAENDPHNLGTLHDALLTLFRCSTLEDWTDIMYINLFGCKDYGYEEYPEECVASNGDQGILAVAYFVSFIVLSNMMILNLFIGVITSSMQDAKTELTAELEQEAAASNEGDAQTFMEGRLDELTELLMMVTEEMEYYACRYKERKIAELLRASRASRMDGKFHDADEYLEELQQMRKPKASSSSVDLLDAESGGYFHPGLHSRGDGSSSSHSHIESRGDMIDQTNAAGTAVVAASAAVAAASAANRHARVKAGGVM